VAYGHRPKQHVEGLDCVTALDHMLRVHRWLCREKQRDLQELERLDQRLRAELQQLNGAEPSGAVDVALRARRARLEQSVADAESALARARDELAQAQVELGHIERRESGRVAPLPEPFRQSRRSRSRRG
jgi:DNA repair ATPase RecN